MQIKVDSSLAKALAMAGLQQQTKKTVKRNASEMQQKAMRSAAVDTGFMKRSIGIDTSDGGYIGTVAPTAEYAIFVEMGTRHQAAQPFMRPNFMKQRVIFIKDLYNLLK